MNSTVRDRQYYFHVLWQTTFAMVFVYGVLLSLDHVAAGQLIWAAGTGSLASSSFCVFCTPRAVVSQPLRIIGGYVVGMVSGEAMRLLSHFLCLFWMQCHAGNMSAHFSMHMVEMAAVASVGVTLLLMVLLRLEHPPAAGLAVVLVVDVKSMLPVLVILCAALVLALIRWLLNKQLLPLV